jgi:hypothetical protein
MSTTAMDLHHEKADPLSSLPAQITAPIQSVITCVKSRYNGVMNKAREFSRIVERIKQGDKLSKTDWVAIGAMPLTFVIAGYYAFNVASKKTGEFVSSMKQQYHSVLKSI